MTRPDDYAVAFVVDDAHVGPTAVAATSVVANSPSPFHFYLLDLGLGRTHRQQLQDVIGAKRTTFLSVPDLEPAGAAVLGDRTLSSHDRNFYATCVLPELLVDRCDRFVYLAWDSLTVGDLAPLFELNLGVFPVGAVPVEDYSEADASERPHDVHATCLRAEYPCLDSGVLLVDTRAFADRGVGRRAIEYGRSRRVLPDGREHALCAALRGEWREFGHEWNFPDDEALRQAHDGPLPVVHRSSARRGPAPAGRRTRDVEIMYEEYRLATITAGGPTFPGS